ncbi:hypothetical protein CZ787_02465 [Halomonas citrativorans]|uniref:Uncharacterized protein n=1 Tax=Halomonas citrativorans TaxID=2742612 RepID=A0A1R4HQT8_9GAMM|nr:hypothetical protein CZ787_02465 [Halomonas citrativorans]
MLDGVPVNPAEMAQGVAILPPSAGPAEPDPANALLLM